MHTATKAIPVPIAQSVQKAADWLFELQSALHDEDGHKSYRVLRAVLQALRDRLPAPEAADLAAQLPLVIRGMFYEGYSAEDKRMPARSREEFLASVAERLQLPHDPSPETSTRMVFRLLREHVSEGELNDVQAVLPKPLRELWT